MKSTHKIDIYYVDCVRDLLLFSLIFINALIKVIKIGVDFQIMKFSSTARCLFFFLFFFSFLCD